MVEPIELFGGDVFLTDDQVAQALSVEARTVQNWFKTGKIPGAVQIGYSHLIRKSVFEEYILGLERASVENAQAQKDAQK